MTRRKDSLFEAASREGGGTTVHLVAGVLLAMLISGCVALRPVDEVATAVGSGRFVEIDGVRVHLEDGGSGDPIVLVHGFGGSTFSWRQVSPRLARRFRVIAVDLVGFGLSARPSDRSRYGRVEQVTLLAELLETLGLQSAHWVGHSYGGGLVTTLAHHFPERVRSLTLVSSTAPDYAERRRGPAGRKFFALPFIRMLALRPAFVRRALERSVSDDSLVDEELVTGYLDRVRVEGVVDAYVGLTAPGAAPGPKWEVDFAEIDIPVLVLWGADDSLIPVAEARDAVARLPDARFKAIPDCGHIPMEESPKVVAREIINFLTALDGAPSERLDDENPAVKARPGDER